MTERLLAARNERGHWRGRLSSSALSTATAVAALAPSGRYEGLVRGGADWLERTRNADGGWGDTELSISNISTTALCWAALTIAGRGEGAAAVGGREWMRRAAGGLEPARLASAIADRYGNDRTFSVPILTVLAVAGIVPWRLVPQLPFELAACPQSWFRWLGLPVVSYALPALIAIGHARHRRRPSRNPLARSIRLAAGAETLRVLERIQPENGGYLEAVPLTSFVCLSLQAAGYGENAALAKGLRFLEASARADGSWPIDTDLATWVTTLSVQALGERVPVGERAAIREWLLGQQYLVRHPYTGAAPGGWAWTDLPGGVPDADDTAGALRALRILGGEDLRVLAAAEAGVVWLLDLQNRDGGIPTFCRGWGKLPFDRSSPDITAHALQAWADWEAALGGDLRARIAKGRERALGFLAQAQRGDGAFVPLWFGSQYGANDENPVYGTARVLAAVRGTAMGERAAAWLVRAQNADGGWGGDKGLASSVEETGLAVSALAGLDECVGRGVAWMHRAMEREITPSPIGFYFARLWYFEELYPLVFATEGLRRAGTLRN